MADVEPQTLAVGTGNASRRIAYRANKAPETGRTGLFWLSGFKSDMASTKAMAVADWAAQNGLAATRFDYSGHGVSDGAFTDGTIGRWLEESRAVFSSMTTGPQIIIGSSMGGYIALLLLRQLLREASAEAQRVRALVLIAPAWDMTEELMWKQFPPEARQALLTEGLYLRPSEYGEPYAITRQLIEEGRRHRLAEEPFDPGRPVVVIQGLLDRDVPAEHVRRLPALLTGGHVRIIEIADGEHRLSRPEDLAVLFDTLRSLV